MLDLNKIYCMDCLDGMKQIDDGSVDLVVTDPPYFLINKTGSGFMGKKWDSLNIYNAFDILCNSKEIANIVERFFLSMRVDSSMIGGNFVRETVCTKERGKVIKSNATVLYAEKNLKDISHISKANINSVQGIVLTKQEVLGMLKELSLNHITAIENLKENVLFAVPILYIKSQLKNIVPENVLNLHIEKICVEGEIQLTSMADAKIRGRIEGMTGILLEKQYTKETDIHASCVENTVENMKYKHITLKNIEKQKIIRWITLLLSAIHVTQKQKKNLSHSLMYYFHKIWAEECLRILKPGAFAFVMCIPRQDCLSIMINALKDAGFRTDFTSIFWTFASGFPKSQNIGLTIDKQECRRRLTEELGRKPTKKEFDDMWKTFRDVIAEVEPFGREGRKSSMGGFGNSEIDYGDGYLDNNLRVITEPATDQAKELDGSYAGFQPKPAVEIVIVAMKPLSENTYVDQALKNGKGITWLGNARIPVNLKIDDMLRKTERKPRETQTWEKGSGFKNEKNELTGVRPEGRFPANLLVNDDVLNTGKKWKSGGSVTGKEPSQPTEDVYGKYGRVAWQSHDDSGSYSRYFDLDLWFNKQMEGFSLDIQNTFPFIAVPKASKSEKNKGVKNMEKDIGHNRFDKCKTCGGYLLQNPDRPSACKCKNPVREHNIIKGNFHPTVKPLKLMAYLVVLGSREEDVVLDPYIGSGTTGLACKLLNRKYIGFENNVDYYKIAQARLSTDIKKYKVHIDKKLLKDDELEDEPPEKDCSTRLDDWI